MKRWLLMLVMTSHTLMAGAYHSGVNESETAAAKASCNAAFHSGCASDSGDDQSYTASSSGFAAPAGDLGSSALECAIVALLVSGTLVSRFRQARLREARPGDIC